MFPAKAQRAAGDVKFQTAVGGLGDEPIDEGGWTLRLGSPKPGKQKLKMIIVHRPPIVRVGEAEVPNFRSLVKIRQTGRCRLKQELGEGVEDSRGRDLRLE